MAASACHLPVFIIFFLALLPGTTPLQASQTWTLLKVQQLLNRRVRRGPIAPGQRLLEAFDQRHPWRVRHQRSWNNVFNSRDRRLNLRTKGKCYPSVTG
jgi:hypothetical protein